MISAGGRAAPTASPGLARGDAPGSWRTSTCTPRPVGGGPARRPPTPRPAADAPTSTGGTDARPRADLGARPPRPTLTPRVRGDEPQLPRRQARPGSTTPDRNQD